MRKVSVSLDVSYSQVAIFDSSLAQPFNDWSEAHVRQGFAWRVGSVSFGTIEGAGPHLIEIVMKPEDTALPLDAIRIIQVPFEVPPSGSIEVASISDGAALNLPAGTYALRFECYSPAGQSKSRIRLVFMSAENPTFQVLRADSGLSPGRTLLLTASPA